MLTPRRPWHQRFAAVRVPRALLRAGFFRALRAAARTDDGRRIAWDTLGDLVTRRPKLQQTILSTAAPYPELGRQGDVERPSQGGGRPVFITARFRSGSTVLWNIFRHIDGFTAYYEPFNERRWFDPQHRGTRVDPTHRDISDYWREYDGLERLAAVYDESWTRRSLYMDGDAWNPAMIEYVNALVSHAPGRAVLQFNRIDLRLPWFVRSFPQASLVHLYRHPRDQWCSSLPDWSACSPTATMTDFARADHYYLRPWAEDLQQCFPFLNPATISHPYRLSYYIWKLSFWYGVAHCDHSLSFEALLEQPERELERLLAAVGMPQMDVGALSRLITPNPPRWPQYADDSWFRRHEQACEEVLADFFEIESGPGLQDATKQRVSPAR